MENDITFERFSELSRQFAHKLNERVSEPDGDVDPAMMTFTPVSEPPHPRMRIWELPHEMFESPETKEVMARRIMATAIDAVGAKMVCFVSAVWTLRRQYLGVSEQEAAKIMRQAEVEGVAGNPLRQEGVMVTTLSETEHGMWIAEILRKPGALPTLGEWQDWFPGVPAHQVDSRFNPPLLAALRASSGVYDHDHFLRVAARASGFRSAMWN